MLKLLPIKTLLMRLTVRYTYIFVCVCSLFTLFKVMCILQTLCTMFLMWVHVCIIWWAGKLSRWSMAFHFQPWATGWVSFPAAHSLLCLPVSAETKGHELCLKPRSSTITANVMSHWVCRFMDEWNQGMSKMVFFIWFLKLKNQRWSHQGHSSKSEIQLRKSGAYLTSSLSVWIGVRSAQMWCWALTLQRKMKPKTWLARIFRCGTGTGSTSVELNWPKMHCSSQTTKTQYPANKQCENMKTLLWWNYISITIQPFLSTCFCHCSMRALFPLFW